MKKIIFFYFALPTCVLFSIILSVRQIAFAKTWEQRSPEAIQKDMESHQEDIQKMEMQWAIIRTARSLEESGNLEEAVTNYNMALSMGDQNVPRQALLEVYEKMGKYDKALEQVEWFLSGNQNEQGRAETLKVKERLLKKLHDSRGNQIAENVKSNLRELSKEKQKGFVDSLSNESVEGLFKQAMNHELNGEFAKALKVYETLLGHQDQIEQQVNAHAWAMLYPGIQRTAELSGNTEKEKQALLWIRDQLISDKGEYAASANYLEAATIQHIKERIHYWGLNENK